MTSTLLSETLASFSAPPDFGAASPFHRLSFPAGDAGEDVAIVYDADDDESAARVRVEHTGWERVEASSPRTTVMLVVTLAFADGRVEAAHDGKAPLSLAEGERQLRALIARLQGRRGLTPQNPAEGS
jgi:hypothetical protein